MSSSPVQSASADRDGDPSSPIASDRTGVTLNSSPSNEPSGGIPSDVSEPITAHDVSTVGPTRVPGTYPPEWLPDNQTDSCMACNSPFTLIKRRHHCRSCGKIFCGDCCRQKAKLLYLDNKEARVCSNCSTLIEYTLLNTGGLDSTASHQEIQPSPSGSSVQPRPASTQPKVQGVLKTSNQARSGSNECNTSSSSSDQQANKQVMFSDGIRPGTDLSESSPYPASTSSSTAADNLPSASFSLLTRQSRQPEGQTSSHKSRSRRSHENLYRNVTVCDEIGYLPPIVISKESPIANMGESNQNTASSLSNLIANQFRGKKNIQDSMDSRSCPLNGIMRFEEISGLVGVDDVITFILLKDLYLKVKVVTKDCCIDRKIKSAMELKEGSDVGLESSDEITECDENHLPQYWCFTSEGLARFGQSEVMLVLDRDQTNLCIPRDVFKVYLTLHELSLRRQSLENMGNLLFQDGLFDNRDTAGLLFVRPMETHCLKNLVVPASPFLVALVLQRWEVPWSKVFPVRLLLRLGHKFKTYPYPIASFRARDPVYYEVGHTIISILGDFRNFRYSITHVDGLKVMLNKKTRKVSIKLNQSCYQQFNKVLDSSNNEHVLAWSSFPFPEADGHLVSVQNEDGQYETVEFYKDSSESSATIGDVESSSVLGASFVIFSGALKVNTSGQSAKISIVEDGLLIQIQSCTMSALKNAIHFMHNFDIDCENNQDPLNRVEIDWQIDSS